MTVNDPHEEVTYDEEFACNDLGHKYLDETTLERLLAEADGELARDDSVGSENHPPNSVKRIKRRRKQNAIDFPPHSIPWWHYLLPYDRDAGRR